MSDQDRKSYYEKEDDVYGPNNNNSLYSNGTLHYCSIYRYVVGLFIVDTYYLLDIDLLYVSPYIIHIAPPVLIL